VAPDRHGGEKVKPGSRVDLLLAALHRVPALIVLSVAILSAELDLLAGA
jgi:hypothetical protein